MQERTFRAPRYDEALAQIKRELGPEAVILGTRQLGGSFGKKTEVEVRAVAAAHAPSNVRPSTGGRKSSVLEPKTATMLERRLLLMGVPDRAAAELAGAVSAREPEHPHGRWVERALAEVLSETMLFGGSAGQAGRVVALVGPTGVGKTTTIAKIAAHAALVEERSVGLVSIDQYRIGAAEQIERYADLIGVPVEIAHDARSLEIALRRLSKADLVLVDTAGRSPRDPFALGEMADTLRGVDEPVEVHLAVPANMRDCELRATVERHAVLSPVRLLATKLDEAFYHGSIVAAQAIGGLPFSYFTTGQRVPEDFEVASPERLAALLCGAEVE